MLVRKIAGRGDAARGRRVAVLAGGESNRQRSPLVRYFRAGGPDGQSAEPRAML